MRTMHKKSRKKSGNKSRKNTRNKSKVLEKDEFILAFRIID